MNLKDLIFIVYNGGSYGTYLHWVLYTLSTDVEIRAPFGKEGNSHLFDQPGPYALDHPEWEESIVEQNDKLFSRAHPKTQKNTSLDNSLELAIKKFKKVLYLYPDHGSVLLNINNAHNKIWDNWLSARLTDSVFANNLYKNWPVDKHTPVDKIPVWVVREILSFNLLPSWYSEVEWYHPNRWSNPSCHLILIHDLLYDFENTISKIQGFCNLEFKKPIAELLPYHIQMLSLQKYLTQDQLAKDIVYSTINDLSLDWKGENLPIATQAWIQWHLRELGYELRCNGLDIFPTNSVQLQELIYKA